jgi:hypothetical protein
MAGYIQVPPDSTGKKVDTVTLSDAGSEVHRQKLVVTGGSGTAEVVVVTNAAPGVNDMGLVVRQAGTADVALAGKVTLSGTAVVAGVISLATGANVIGDLNAISRTVQVAIATPFTLNDISRTVQVAVGTPFVIQGISTTVSVAGNVNISATATVAGTINLSGSVQVSGSVGIFTNASTPSASRGPRCILASTSSNVTLVAAPGNGMAIFVTALGVTNASGSNTRARAGTSASIGQVTMMMAQSGGGFVMPFTPPWKLSANEALLGSVKPNASEGIFNIHFYVASADST